MGGKSNRKNKKASLSGKPTNSVEAAVVASSDVPNGSLLEASKVEANEISESSMAETAIASSEATESQNADESQTVDESQIADDSAKQANQGDLHLFPVPVKTQGGEKLELHLNPGDSVMDVRQFLLDAPETCFFTCYDLLLHTKDGSLHHLEDYNEISEVADITSGGCSLEMVAALYDDRSIRAHVHRSRELLSVSSLHTSLSTSLALQHETAKNLGDTAKVEVPELDGLGFMEDVTGSLSNLLSSPSHEIKSVESIVFSSFNPPPSNRRLVGDLIYLDVVTLEGNKYCISGTTKMFYVNSSTGNILDPKISKSNLEATTLIGLLQKVSPKFKKAFREILDKKAAAHPFENLHSVFPPTSWLGMYPIPDHKRDAARAEDALTLSYGSELIGMQRDWNEELQSCREFPHTTPQERILRDRALYKVTSDFVNAAISGAVGVISRSIPPINPTDPECFHMYVHNNIFFSFAIDADLEQLKKSAVDKKLKKEIHGVSNGKKCDGSSVEENGGVIDVAPDGLAEAQLPESEQATYASANNDLKGTMAFQEADVPGLYNLAMAIVDYRGHRVVAQSVLPGILQGDKSDSLLYGSVDNGKKISWNEDFHAKVLEAAKRLHLKEHTVLDESGNAFKLAAPVESKGIVGSDDRHYLLDLMRVTPRDANYNGNYSRFRILRPELITAYCQKVKAAENSKGTSEVDANIASGSSEVSNAGGQVGNEEKVEANSGPQDLTNEDKTEVTEEHSSSPAGSASEEILFNPNVFTDFKLDGSKEEVAADEEDVRKASLYLKDVVLQKFIEDLCTLEVSPMDGQTLTEALHAHGINVRYIGRVAEGTKHLTHLWDLCSNEIVVRSAKHILKDILRDTEDHDLAPSISHFFNCFFGSCPSQRKELLSGKSPKGQAKWKGGAAGRHSQSSYMNTSSLSLWSHISEFSKVKYQFILPEDARSRVKKVSVMRNLCQKIGVTVAARKYDLDTPIPFQTSDILDVQPIVKHSVPLCSEAKELMETGKTQLAEGMLSEAYTLFSDAFVILQQVTGPMHREVANCCRYLAMVLYHAGDMAGAIMQQHKELIINERCLGLDHPDTAHSYGNMALFYHGLNRTELALKHMSRALVLLSLSSGPDHPDVAATFINVAMMYQDIGKMETALRYLQEALTKNERLLGEEHIQTAVCYHALAIAFNCMGAFKLSHQNEKKTYDILVKKLGEDDSRTVDSLNWMKQFKMREIQTNAQKQKGHALDAASAQKAAELLKENPNLIKAIQAAAAVSGGSGASVNSSFNVPMAAESLPRGRGVDERAARATAEVRKKAAAKGLLLRPHGVPVQSVPEVNQHLNIINKEKNKQESSQPSNGSSSISTNSPSSLGQEQDAPAGLGKGFASLKSKKQKSKSKTDP